MPWRLDGLVEERLERCRALLADPSSEHHGSADMRCWVEYADMIVALHRAALDDGCRPRRDLSPAEKLQLCALFVLALHKHPHVSLGVDPAAEEVLMQAARTLPPRWQVVSLGVLACARPGPSYGRMLYDARRDVAATLMDALEGSPEAAAALPGDMAAAGCRHTLTADVLKQAALFYVVKAALEAVTACQEEGRAVPRDVAAGARQAVDELLALRPRWPRYLALGSEVALAVGDGAAAVAGWHAAREAAEAQRAYYWAGQACVDLASALLTGIGGEVRFEPRRAQELLDEGERLWRLSRPWTAPFKRVLAEDLKSARDQLRQSVAAAPPGASLVPVIFRSLWTPAAGPGLQLRCDGCGQTAVELKKCSRCRAAAYCSRECQVQHWREGGHKRECKPK